MEKCDSLLFFNTSTVDDRVLEKLLGDEVQLHAKARAAAGGADQGVIVGCTDRVLAMIMAAPRSTYPFDLRVTRMNNDILVIDKRGGGQTPADLLSVNETSPQPPLTEVDILKQIQDAQYQQQRLAAGHNKQAKADVALQIDRLQDQLHNTPEKLSAEATLLNQKFSQMVLDQKDVVEQPYPNPFYDEDDQEGEGGSKPARVAYRLVSVNF